ncbi:hypothetical protein ACFVWY_26755 [Streptomyces sp. NPDC058195]|uniref:hypothetical protein n=1 Tax=Streptomyces sp. NPDC058195 TaxID=3346375 RepID=UPI0036E83D67
MTAPGPTAYQVEGAAVRLARHLAGTEIDGLLSWSCQQDDVTIELPGISLRVGLHHLQDAGSLRFWAVPHGPGHTRTWLRRMPATATSKDVAARIVSDAQAVYHEFRRGEAQHTPS